MKFTQITESLVYPIRYKAVLSTLHAEIISYGMEHYENTTKFKEKMIQLLNTISTIILNGDTLPASWSSTDPFTGLELIDADTCESSIGSLYLKRSDIEWDISTSEELENPVMTKPIPSVKSDLTDTPKEDLYIRPPVFPQFDYSKPWLNSSKDGNQYTIYTSLPIIPWNQSQISVTTNVEQMTRADLLRLFPNHRIHTRAAAMYEPCDGLDFDDRLGMILPITGFTAEQVRENIIKYPHFYKLKRNVNGKLVSFYSNIEIDGKLLDTLEIWDSLPESKLIPKTSEFIKEYVVRRYLLERDVLGVKHQYPLFGTLDPFLTLFTTAEEYRFYGYTDAVALAKKCVLARVSYKQSRNPVIRKVMDLS